MVNSMTNIDLATLTRGEVRNLSGHERGLAARREFNLDAIDATGDPVRVVVPAELDAITSSFFQGMFAKSVQKFANREEFLDQYRFEASPVILRQVQRGIDRIVTERGNVLSA